MQTFTNFSIKGENQLTYQLLKIFFNKTRGDDAPWSIIECNDDEQSIEFDDEYGTTLDDVLEYILAMTKIYGKVMEEKGQLKMFQFSLEGIVDYDGSEEETYRVEFEGGKMTVQETPRYVHFGSCYFSDYDEFTAECGDILDENEFDNDFEINVCNGKAYVYEYPPYGEKVDINKYKRYKVITFADEDIVAYFEDHGIAYDEKKLNSLSVVDVVDIMNGVYKG